MSEKPEPLALMTVTRIYAGGEKGATEAQLRKDVGSLLRAPIDVLKGRLDRVLTELENTRQVDVQRTRKTTRYLLSEAGRALAAKHLGLPSGKTLTWPALRDGYLIPAALGRESLSENERKRLKSASGLRGAVLARQHGLPLEGIPTLGQALDALLWKQVGRDTDKAFKLNDVKAWLLNQMIESERPLPLQQLQALLPARAADAARNDAAGLRQAILAKWAQPAQDTPLAQPLPPEPSPDPALADHQLEVFVQRALEAARTSPKGWFGDHKIFIGHAYRSLVAVDANETMTLARYKDLLVEANHRGMVELARADLVEAMDQQDLRESETRYLHAIFHFLVLT